MSEGYYTDLNATADTMKNPLAFVICDDIHWRHAVRFGSLAKAVVKLPRPQRALCAGVVEPTNSMSASSPGRVLLRAKPKCVQAAIVRGTQDLPSRGCVLRVSERTET